MTRVVKKEQIVRAGFREKSWKCISHATRRRLRVLQEKELRFRYALLAKIFNEPRVTPILLGKGIEHVLVLPLKNSHGEHPCSLRLPIPVFRRSRLSESTTEDDDQRNADRPENTTLIFFQRFASY